MGSLPAERQQKREGRRPAGWGRAWSGRRVKSIVEFDQRWRDRDGGIWHVRQIYRKDQRVLLQSSGGRLAVLSFARLGREYRLASEGVERHG
jgi:hypothetical protein